MNNVLDNNTWNFLVSCVRHLCTSDSEGPVLGNVNYPLLVITPSSTVIQSGSACYRPMYVLSIGIMVRVFTNGSGDLGSILGRVTPKTQKRYLLSTQHYMVQIKVN